MSRPRYSTDPRTDTIARGIWQAGVPWPDALKAARIIRRDEKRSAPRKEAEPA